MITDAQLKEWKDQAEKDDLLDDYEYHLGMVENSLPYRKWKIKFNMLNSIQERPDYYENLSQHFIDQETQLCNELGY